MYGKIPGILCTRLSQDINGTSRPCRNSYITAEKEKCKRPLSLGWATKPALSGSHRLINIRPQETVFVPAVAVTNLSLDWAIALQWIILTPISMDQPTRARGSLGCPTSNSNTTASTKTTDGSNPIRVYCFCFPLDWENQPAMGSSKGSDGTVPKVSTLLWFNLFLCTQQSRPETGTWSAV